MGEQTPQNKRLPSHNQSAYAERVRHWQMIFDDVPAGPQWDAAAALRSEAAADLNISFDMEGGDYVAFSDGYGLREHSDGYNEPVLVEEHIAGNFGYYDGHEVVRRGTPDKPSWRVAHKFMVEEIDEDGDQVETEMYIYALGGMVTSLTEIEAAYEAIVGEQESPAYRELCEVALEAAYDINDNDFLLCSIETQRFYVDSNLEKARLIGDKYSIFHGPVLVGTPYAYVLDKAVDTPHYERIMIDETYAVDGLCLGVVMLAKRQLDAGKPIRTVHELIDVTSLCLVVQPSTVSVGELSLPSNQLLYIPINEEIEAIFATDTNVSDVADN